MLGADARANVAVSAGVVEVMVLAQGQNREPAAMAQHAPVITTLRPGVLRVNGPDGAKDYVVTGGFAEISATGTSVLAEKAMLASEAKADDLDALVAAATEVLGKSAAEAKDAAEKQLSDLQALRSAVGV